MTNIWSFLVQTAAVSMTILILWVVKRLMREHFSLIEFLVGSVTSSILFHMEAVVR